MSVGKEGQKYRRAHDPYNGMEQAIIRPKNIARQELSDAEKNATKNNHQNSDASLRSREQNQLSDISPRASHFRNAVTGRNTISKHRLSFNSKSSRGKKRFAPIALIFSLIFGGGGLFYASQSFLGPNLSNLYTNATDMQFTSYNARNQRLFKYLLNGGDQVKIGLNFNKKYTTFTPYMKSRLKKNGIQVGYLDADGVFKTNQLVSTSKTVLKYNDEIIDANSFQNKFASDVNFREAYYKAKRGRVAGFFDDSADMYYKKRGATRDIFDQYKSTGDEETDAKNFQDTISDRVTNGDGDINTVRRDVDEETGEEKINKNGEDLQTGKISGDTPEAKARVMVNNIAGKVSNVGVPVCSALRIANMTAVTVSAIQIAQATAYFLSLMEPISKTMAGEGDASGINQALNFLTRETTEKVQYINEDGTTSEREVTGSPLMSSGAKLILGNTKSSKNETAPYSIHTIIRGATTIALSTGITNTACDGVMAASAIVSLVANATPGGALAKFVVSAVAHTIGGIALTGIVSVIISSFIPYVAKIFAGNVWEAYTGIPAGEFFTLGAAKANSGLATQSSAYAPADEEYVKEQNRQTTVALAQEAEIDRKNRSPFDASSKNTFLGSLVSKFAYLGYTNNPLSTLASFTSVLSNSLNIFNPSASAYDQDLSYTSNYQECENLKGAVCDMYGNEIVAMDYSTIDLAPDDPTYVSVIEPNIDNDGKIIKNSELAKYITACTERESPWGVLDANIMNTLQTDFGTIGNSAFLINDAVDIINAAEDIANRGWGTGENCRMSSSNPRWNTEFKYYQRYIEDMRILNGMDDESENPVIAYKNDYAEEHPLDNSYAGTLARITGQTKDDIAFLLEFSKYSNEIAEYDPATRFKFSETLDTHNEITLETPTLSTTAYITTPQAILLTDRRNYTV